MSVNEILGAIMLFGMVAVIFIGFPISFTLLFLALIFGGLGLGWLQTFDLAYLQIWGTMKDEILPSVPLFIFMGYMTEQAGLMERLFLALRLMLSRVRGALYLAVILTATIFAMATGIVGAAVTVLGIMAGPIMIKTGYDARLSSGAIAAGGTLGVLIPPSVMLVVMGPTMGVPVNQLYSAAFGPGFLLAGMYIAYCLIRSFINPSLGPPVPPEERAAAMEDVKKDVIPLPIWILGLVCLLIMAPMLVYGIVNLAQSILGLWFKVPEVPVAAELAVGGLFAIWGAIQYVRAPFFRSIIVGIAPLSALIFFTLGTILGGLATPTEAASCGAFGATFLALLYGKLSIGKTPTLLFTAMSAVGAIVGYFVGHYVIGGVPGGVFGALCFGAIPGFLLSPPMRNAGMGTMVTSSMVLLLAVASNVFGAVFTKLGTAGVITNALISLPLADLWKLALIMLIIFILGWPFEWPAIILVFLPIFLPVVEKLKVHGLNKLELLIWFGALVAVNLQTAFLSPPVAMSAYYLRNVVPQWSLATIYRGMADYMVIQCLALVTLFFVPDVALWLVRVLK
jgi:TRAP-type mannitol/chloroaromatic compound transport system permease large subunit